MSGTARNARLIKAIETTYKGYRFRSRLEARWAVYFDLIGAEWTYEIEGFDLPSGRYLPDFFVRLSKDDSLRDEFPEGGYWIEIKGQSPNELDLRLLAELAKHTNHSAFLLKGDPVECFLWSIHRESGLCKTVVNFPSLAPLTLLGNPWFTTDGEAAALSSRSARFEFGECGVKA